jgi:hypothetical protein
MAVLLSSPEMESGSGDVGRIDPANLWERDKLFKHVRESVERLILVTLTSARNQTDRLSADGPLDQYWISDPAACEVNRPDSSTALLSTSQPSSNTESHDLAFIDWLTLLKLCHCPTFFSLLLKI